MNWDDDSVFQKQALIVTAIITIIAVLTILLFTTSCTISFSNVDTHGTASDLIDEDQAATANTSPQVSIPTSLIPK